MSENGKKFSVKVVKKEKTLKYCSDQQNKGLEDKKMPALMLRTQNLMLRTQKLKLRN